MSESTDLVSIIVANYNNANYLSACIQSVLVQTYPNIEIIVVDDASTDNSCEIIGGFSDSRVRFVQHASNKGVAGARNTGIRSASGNLVATLDADDIYVNPKKIENEFTLLNKHLEESGEQIVSFSNTAFINRNNGIKELIGNNLQPIKEGMLYRDLWKRKIFVPRDYLIDKKILFEVGMYDESLGLYEDWDLKIRIARHYPYYFNGEVGTGYRRRNGLSRAPGEVHRKWMNAIIKKHKEMRRQEQD